MSHKLTSGIVGVLHSPSGVLSLIILALSTVLCFLGKIDGTSWGVVVTVIGGMFHVSHAFIQGKLLENQPQPPTNMMGGPPNTA